MGILNQDGINAKIAANKKVETARKQSKYDKTNAVLNAFNKHKQKANDIMDTLFFANENRVAIKSDFKGIKYSPMAKSFRICYEPMPNYVVHLSYYPRTGVIEAGRNRNGCIENYKYPFADKNVEAYAVESLNREKEHGIYINDLIIFADKFPEYLAMVENEINKL